jgi:dipeptidyl-peptidase-4
MLNLENIFSSDYFADEGFDRPRWCSRGSTYTTLKHIQTSSLTAMDLTSTTSSSTNIINTQIKEIILHDATTGTCKAFVSFIDLIPLGESYPLSIDDYTSSEDMSKVLIFTKSQKVWRLKTRGSYWILDIKHSNSTTPKLRPLGGGSNNLMFATFSPDFSKVAYVRDHNIFVEDLLTHAIVALTNDGSSTIINGTFDWVYEEEFHLRNGFRLFAINITINLLILFN